MIVQQSQINDQNVQKISAFSQKVNKYIVTWGFQDFIKFLETQGHNDIMQFIKDSNLIIDGTNMELLTKLRFKNEYFKNNQQLVNQSPKLLEDIEILLTINDEYVKPAQNLAFYPQLRPQLKISSSFFKQDAFKDVNDYTFKFGRQIYKECALQEKQEYSSNISGSQFIIMYNYMENNFELYHQSGSINTYFQNDKYQIINPSKARPNLIGINLALWVDAAPSKKKYLFSISVGVLPSQKITFIQIDIATNSNPVQIIDKSQQPSQKCCCKLQDKTNKLYLIYDKTNLLASQDPKEMPEFVFAELSLDESQGIYVIEPRQRQGLVLQQYLCDKNERILMESNKDNKLSLNIESLPDNNIVYYQPIDFTIRYNTKN